MLPIAARMGGMAAFRNIWVHGYLKRDLEKFYRVVGERMKDLAEVAAIYAGLLRSWHISAPEVANEEKFSR